MVLFGIPSLWFLFLACVSCQINLLYKRSTVVKAVLQGRLGDSNKSKVMEVGREQQRPCDQFWKSAVGWGTRWTPPRRIWSVSAACLCFSACPPPHTHLHAHAHPPHTKHTHLQKGSHGWTRSFGPSWVPFLDISLSFFQSFAVKMQRSCWYCDSFG